MFKRTWNKRYGKSEIFKKDDSFCKDIEIDMVKLADGDQKAYRERDKEYGVLILCGTCSVEGKDFKYEKIGERETVFDGNATCVYVPRNTDFTITAIGEVSICVTKSPSTRDHKPVLIRPEDVVEKDMLRAASGQAILRISMMMIICRLRHRQRKYITMSLRIRAALGFRGYTPWRVMLTKPIRFDPVISLKFRAAIIRFMRHPVMTIITFGLWREKTADSL